MNNKERIATELMGWEGVVKSFNPYKHPVHTTAVLNKLREIGSHTLIYCKGGWEACVWDQAGEGYAGEGDTWMEALCNAVIAYLDGVKDE